MCYHTTYLFSLCGHTSVSSQPIKDARQCRVTSQDQDSEAASAKTPLRSSIDLLSSFPSPQEFEFAKELHNSLPASPVSPLRSKYDTENLIDTYTSKYKTIISPVKARNASLPTKISNFEISCPIIKRHPLHTFLIPNLCLYCRRARERNMARFEAEAIRDSVDMALIAGSRNRKSIYGNSVINDERRKISPPRGKKGTIPLLLSELQTLIGGETGFEGIARAEVQTSEEVEARVNSGTSAEPVSTDAVVSIASTPKTMQAQVQVQVQTGESEVPNSQDTQPRNTSTLSSAATAPSWWRWRKPSATADAALASPPLTMDTPPATPPATSRRKSSVKTNKHRRSSSTLSSPTSQSGLSRLSWRGKYDQDVQRDVLGRSTKGMNRIMGWSGEGDNDQEHVI